MAANEFTSWNGLPLPDNQSFKLEDHEYLCAQTDNIHVVQPHFDNIEARVDRLNKTIGYECIDLVRNHGQPENGNVVLFSKQTLNKYTQLQCHIVRLIKTDEESDVPKRSRSGSLIRMGSSSSSSASLLEDLEDDDGPTGKLVGFLLTLPMTFRLIKGELDIQNRMIATTYLCIHQEHRKKGLAMMAIRKCIEFGLSIKAQIGYQMVPKKIAHSRQLQTWYRPLDYKRARALGYDLNNYTRPSDRNSSMRNRLAFNTRMPGDCTFLLLKHAKTLAFYNDNLKIYAGHHLYWSPTPEEWKDWLNFAPTYMVSLKLQKQKGSPRARVIGFFSFISQEVLIKRSNKVAKCAQITWFTGDHRVLKTAIHVASKDHDVLQIYDYAGNHTKIFKSLKMMKSNAKINMLFVNLRENPEDVYLPFW